MKTFSLKFGIQSLLTLILVRSLARSLWANSVTLYSIRLYMKGNWLRGSNSFSQKHLQDRQYWRRQRSYIITIKCLTCFNKEESPPYLSWPRRGGDECLSQVRMYLTKVDLLAALNYRFSHSNIWYNYSEYRLGICFYTY